MVDVLVELVEVEIEVLDVEVLEVLVELIEVLVVIVVDEVELDVLEVLVVVEYSGLSSTGANDQLSYVYPTVKIKLPVGVVAGRQVLFSIFCSLATIVGVPCSVNDP